LNAGLVFGLADDGEENGGVDGDRVGLCVHGCGLWVVGCGLWVVGWKSRSWEGKKRGGNERLSGWGDGIRFSFMDTAESAKEANPRAVAENANARHFARKEAWKNEPGNRFTPEQVLEPGRSGEWRWAGPQEVHVWPCP